LKLSFSSRRKEEQASQEKARESSSKIILEFLGRLEASSDFPEQGRAFSDSPGLSRSFKSS
jgi:hypothetical protein